MTNAEHMLEAEVPPLDVGTVGRLKLLMEDVSEDGEDLARDLLLTYRKDVGVRLERLERALAASDLLAAAEAVHALKGASATVGARRVTELCSHAEPLLRAGEVPLALESTLRREADGALAALEHTLQGPAHD